MVGVEGAQRLDEVALALGFCADASGLLNGGKPFRKVGFWRWTERIEEQALGDAPVGDRAVGITFDHVLEGLFGRAVPERMLVQHSAVEKLLCFRFARRGKVDLPELLRIEQSWAGAPKGLPGI